MARETQTALEGLRLAEEAAHGFKEATEAISDRQEKNSSDWSGWELAEGQSFQEFCIKIEVRMASLELGTGLGPCSSGDIERLDAIITELRVEKEDL